MCCHLVSLDGLCSPGQQTDKGALTSRGLDHAAAQAALMMEDNVMVTNDDVALTGVLWRNSWGSPIAWPSQSITRDSSSVQAGELA